MAISVGFGCVSQSIHATASAGYEAEATTYARARPRYHPEILARFVERYGDGRIVELGAGTGLFTRALVAAQLDVHAVEPVEAMRDELIGTIPSARVSPGSAEAIPEPDAVVDTVVAAQAFHWFDHRPALNEIARTLRPGGHLVCVWNVRDETVPWMAELTAITEPYAGSTPRHRTMHWRNAIARDERFVLVDDWAVDNPVPSSPDRVVDRTLSTSFIAALDPETQQVVLDRVRALTQRVGDSFPFCYRCELQAWRLL